MGKLLDSFSVRLRAPFLRPGLGFGTAPRAAAVKTGRRPPPERREAVLTAASTAQGSIRSELQLISSVTEPISDTASQPLPPAGLPPRPSYFLLDFR